jgi:hypothetical protein
MAASLESYQSETSQPEKFLNIPDTVSKRSDLTASSKLVFGVLNRYSLISRKHGKDVFRLRKSKIAELTGLSASTVTRCLYQLRGKPQTTGTPGRPSSNGSAPLFEFDPLIQVIATGRSSYYRILPIQQPEPLQQNSNPSADEQPTTAVDNFSPQNQNDVSEKSSQTFPHKEISFKKDNVYELPINVDNSIISNDMRNFLNFKFEEIGFGLDKEGKRILSVDDTLKRFELSYVLSWIEKISDFGADLQNPAAYLYKRLAETAQNQPQTS